MQTGAGVAQAPAHSSIQSIDMLSQRTVSPGPNQFYDAPSRVHTLESTIPEEETQRTTPAPQQKSGWRSLLGRRTKSTDKTDYNQETHELGGAGGSGHGSDDEKRKELEHINTASTNLTTFEQAQTGLLYRDGQLVLLPAASKDPRDPLNLPLNRKIAALVSLCLFGALAASAELILGALLPVFALLYAGIDPKFLKTLTDSLGGFPEGADPLSYLQDLGGPPLWHVYLLASTPILMIGISNLALIPLAIACGRRTIVLVTGVIAIAGCIGAGFTKESLGAHIAARIVQALGAGTVESLIPFIIQDMVHVHQRNTYISGVFAAQGLIIIGLGIASPHIIITLDWRWIYWITAAASGFFLVFVFFLLPETRWPRTKAEMNGVPRDDPRSPSDYPPRTWKYDLAFFHGEMEWKKGWYAFVDTLRTFFYPQIFFITMLNSAMIACALAAGYTVAPALLTKPWAWSFLDLGLCLIPLIFAAILVGILTGFLADHIANYIAKKRGKRVPENQMWNLVLPTICALVGAVIYGLAGSNPSDYHWAVFLLGLTLMAFGFLGANTVGAVYVLECYPQLAGPALVNIASFRCLIAFALSFKVAEWIIDFGYFESMMIYTALMGFFALLIPVVYIYGPAWRRRWPAERFGDNRGDVH